MSHCAGFGQILAPMAGYPKHACYQATMPPASSLTELTGKDDKDSCNATTVKCHRHSCGQPQAALVSTPSTCFHSSLPRTRLLAVGQANNILQTSYILQAHTLAAWHASKLHPSTGSYTQNDAPPTAAAHTCSYLLPLTRILQAIHQSPRSHYTRTLMHSPHLSLGVHQLVAAPMCLPPLLLRLPQPPPLLLPCWPPALLLLSALAAR
jgi:hypothetical protein